MYAAKQVRHGKGGALAILVCAVRVMTRPSERVQQAQTLFLLADRGFEAALQTFGASAKGSALLKQRPDSIALVRDRAALAEMPLGSLGQAYHRFMVGQGIDEEPYLAGILSARQGWAHDPVRAWFRVRVEIAHDLRHVLTGYGIDAVGEICLLAFRFGQTGNRAVALLTLLSTLRLILWRKGMIASLREAYRNGRSARLLDLLPWEAELDRPLEDIRAEFAIRSPDIYRAHKRARAAARRQAIARPPVADQS